MPTPLRDLPVGENLQDHLSVISNVDVAPDFSINRSIRGGLPKMMVGLRYFATGRGAAASPSSHAVAFAPSRFSGERPDFQLGFRPFSIVPEAGGMIGIGNSDAVSIYAALLRPRSRGRIELASPDPAARPRILPNFLADADDAERMIDGVHWMSRIMRAEPMAGQVRSASIPGDSDWSDERVLEYVRVAAGTVAHPVGTCKMGQDERAVVDERLRVRGVEGLRVIDASIMPTIVSGNTNAPTIMIGEKGAAMIREDWKG